VEKCYLLLLIRPDVEVASKGVLLPFRTFLKQMISFSSRILLCIASFLQHLQCTGLLIDEVVLVFIQKSPEKYVIVMSIPR